jgi:ABC-type Zn uptake system ZnuABC Zn-binding protein ZnuA
LLRLAAVKQLSIPEPNRSIGTGQGFSNILPQADFVKSIGGEQVEVNVLIPPEPTRKIMK